MIRGHVNNAGTMKHFLEECGLNPSDSYIIKPNWFFQGNGFYTDTRTLRLLLEYFDKVTVVESYTFQRNDGTRTITPENGKLNRDWIREQDRRFIHTTGFEALFKEYDVEYVNLTEEVWSDRIANSENIRKSVESNFTPVVRKELYEQVPECIYAIRWTQTDIVCKVETAENKPSERHAQEHIRQYNRAQSYGMAWEEGL